MFTDNVLESVKSRLPMLSIMATRSSPLCSSCFPLAFIFSIRVANSGLFISKWRILEKYPEKVAYIGDAKHRQLPQSGGIKIYGDSLADQLIKLAGAAIMAANLLLQCTKNATMSCK